MGKPLETRALDVYLSVVNERLADIESKVADVLKPDEIDPKAKCPNCDEYLDDCKCGGLVDEESIEKKYECLECRVNNWVDVDTKGTRLDSETKVRYVRDSAYWGVPTGTPIAPGMKPTGPASPAGRERAVSVAKRNVGRSLSARANPTVADPDVPTAPRKPVRRVRGASGSDKDRARDVADRETTRDDRLKERRRRASIAAQELEAQQQPELVAPTPDVGETSDSSVDTSVRSADEFSVKDAAETLKQIPVDGRPDGAGDLKDPVDCGDDVEMAHQLLGEGKHVRLNTPQEVSILLDRIAKESAFAKETGGEAPDYDLCKVSAPKTNLFCLESKGIPRVQMPQFSGAPVEGSYAATKFNEEKGESDVVDDFATLLDELGVGVEDKAVPVQELKASQNQLVGAKVAGMRQAMRDGKVPDAPIYVTRDGYIVDGHHRWAAKMGLDLEDGQLGDVDMPVKMIDADIGYILDISNGFTEMAGIKPKATGKAADGVPNSPGEAHGQTPKPKGDSSKPTPLEKQAQDYYDDLLSSGTSPEGAREAVARNEVLSALPQSYIDSLGRKPKGSGGDGPSGGNPHSRVRGNSVGSSGGDEDSGASTSVVVNPKPKREFRNAANRAKQREREQNRTASRRKL